MTNAYLRYRAHPAISLGFIPSDPIQSSSIAPGVSRVRGFPKIPGMNIVHVVEQPPILVASRVQLEVTLLSDFHMPAPTLIMGVTIAIIRFRGKRRANTLHWYSWLKTALIYN